MKLFSQLTLEKSKMDVDVGSFVFSQGVVSAIQIIKDPGYQVYTRNSQIAPNHCPRSYSC